MVSSNALLYATRKTQRRIRHEGESAPIAVQIAGANPLQMALAARFNADHGAQIIDINMGCPAKKVCKLAAGSALMRDEAQVARILDAVVAAVPELPVTLKIRTGWSRSHRNAVSIARIAEKAGIRMLAVHGRTREDLYMGEAEYDTIAEVKASVSIPVIANGDITSPHKAAQVLRHTGADGLMIGRAAQGRPWIFREIAHYLATGEELATPDAAEIQAICRDHLAEIYSFYGEVAGVRIARKHIAAYTRTFAGAHRFREVMFELPDAETQLAAVDAFFSRIAESCDTQLSPTGTPEPQELQELAA
jgi:tRNA-dihydrouridine synthase B